ncbi:hypothetical protein POM88_009409 [Heracleum sosnowskyi]|uniref:Uncharacterized protein n=1 Tax=Heracleum sosnowskyi TaxID=360622 RepID=A0AAD8J9C5_9APIA|nr:hypothetical protein POM88_009409 [Heracleum sosnowskyi]
MLIIYTKEKNAILFTYPHVNHPCASCSSVITSSVDTEIEFHKELDKLLDVLEVYALFYLVVQGFLVSSFVLTWALKNPARILKLAIMNSPLTASSPLPGLFQKLRIPLLGEFTCQNAVMAERFIEADLEVELVLAII